MKELLKRYVNGDDSVREQIILECIKQIRNSVEFLAKKHPRLDIEAEIAFKITHIVTNKKDKLNVDTIKSYLIGMAKKTTMKLILEDRLVKVPVCTYLTKLKMNTPIQLLTGHNLTFQSIKHHHPFDFDGILDETEIKIVKLRMAKFTDEEIAEQLNLSKSMVFRTRQKIGLKLKEQFL